MKPVLVVEGTSDVNRLQNLIDCDFVTTNGSAISRETIKYIKELAKTRRVIIFTDPDYPGNKIRSKIAQEVENVEHCYIKKEYAIKRNKVGVCECDEQELLRALKEIINYKYVDSELKLTNKDLLEFKLIGQSDSLSRRNFVSDKIPIGKTNGKTFLKRINLLGVTKEQIKMWMEEYDDCK